MNNICKFMFWSLGNYAPLFIIISFFILPEGNFENPDLQFSYSKIWLASIFKKKWRFCNVHCVLSLIARGLIFCIQCQNMSIYHKIFLKYLFCTQGRNLRVGAYGPPPW